MMNEKSKQKDRYNNDEEEDNDDRSVSERKDVGSGGRYRDDADRDKGRNRDGGRGGGGQPDKNRDRFKDGKMPFLSNFCQGTPNEVEPQMSLMLSLFNLSIYSNCTEKEIIITISCQYPSKLFTSLVFIRKKSC